MYTYHNFVYGHQLANQPKLNNQVYEFDLYFRYGAGSRQYMIDMPYHGGQVRGDIHSIIWGCHITDDDQNEYYLDEVRAVTKEDYHPGYVLFLTALKEDLLSPENYQIGEPEYDQFVEELISYLDSTEPEFYTVEVSS